MPTNNAVSMERRLDRLAQALRATALAPRRDGNSLVVRNGDMITHVSVTAPPDREPDSDPVTAILTIRTRLPDRMMALILAPEIIDAMNRHAVLGAMVQDNGAYFVGSRLTIHEDPSVWDLYEGFILQSVVASLDGILKAHGPAAAPGPEPSAWSRADFVATADIISMFCRANENWPRLTARFALKNRGAGMAPGENHTALWTIDANEPHPVMGGGLMCRLQLPHAIPDLGRRLEVMNSLNRMEMQPHDLPPFFGAWCAGQQGDNLAHIMFLPNVFARRPGIATNLSIWAYTRAQWADATLTAMGIHPR